MKTTTKLCAWNALCFLAITFEAILTIALVGLTIKAVIWVLAKK